MSPLRRRRLRRRAGARQGPGVAPEVLQVSRLHQDPGLDHRLRRPGSGRLLQDLLREEVGTARIRIRVWLGIPPDRRAHVSLVSLEPLGLYIFVTHLFSFTRV